MAIIFMVMSRPILGIADNGDFIRMMDWFGISHKDPLKVAQGWQLQYPDRLFNQSPPGANSIYPSSEMLFVWLATRLRHLFPGTDFDIRWLGGVHASFYLAGLYILLAALPFSRLWAQILCSAIALFLLLDAAYIAFFNSFFSEAATFVGLLFFTGTALWIARSTEVSAKQMILLGLSALAVTTSKTQTLPLAPLFVLTLLVVSRRMATKQFVPAIGIGLVLVNLAVPLGCLRLSPEGLRLVNKFNVVFLDILPHTDDPAAALRDLKLDPGLVTYKNSDIWALGVTTPDLNARFYPHISWNSIIAFRLLHPTNTLKMLRDTADLGFRLAIPYHGYYERGFEYGPQQQPVAFAAWTNLHQHLPRGSISIPVVLLLALAVGCYQLRSGRRGGIVTGSITIWLVAASVILFATAVVGEGRIDVAKHLIPFHFCFDLTVLWLVYCALEPNPARFLCPEHDRRRIVLPSWLPSPGFAGQPNLAPAPIATVSRLRATVRSAWLSRSRTILWVAVSAIVVWQTLIPPIIGMADNGDFHFMMQPLRLQPESLDEDRFFSYVIASFRDSGDSAAMPVFSTELLLLAPGFLLLRLLGFESYPIWIAGIAHATVFMLAAWLVLPVLLKNGKRFLAVFAVLLFTDVIYVGYFNSLLTDTAPVLFFMLMAASYARLVAGAGSTTVNGRALLICSILFAGSKPQHAPLVLLLGAFLLWQFSLFRELGRRFVAICMIMMFLVGGLTMWWPPAEYRVLPFYSSVFSGILPHADDKSQVLAELGLPVQFLTFSGRDAYDPGSAMRIPEYRSQVEAVASAWRLIEVQARRPYIPVRRVVDGLAEAAKVRAPLIGNYTKSSGHPPGARSYDFALTSSAKSIAFFGSGAAFFLWFILAAAGALDTARRAGCHWFAGVIGLVAMAVFEFLITTLSDTKETTRRLLLFQAMLDILILAAVPSAWRALLAASARLQGTRAAERTSPRRPSRA